MSARAALDSNILVYSVMEPDTPKGQRSAQLILDAAPRGVLAAQSLLEFITAIRRKGPQRLTQALGLFHHWSSVYEVAPTTMPMAEAAVRLLTQHRLQTWDAVIIAAVSAVGADVLFSEDLQDGQKLEGVRIVNPFALTQSALAALLN